MKPALRIICWYGLLVLPMIAALYSHGAFLSAGMGLLAALVISIFAYNNIAELARSNRRQARRVAEVGEMKKEFVSHVSHEL